MIVLMKQYLNDYTTHIVRDVVRNRNWHVIFHGGFETSWEEAGASFHQVSMNISANTFFNFIGLMNNELIRKAKEIGKQPILAVDWTTGPAGISLSKGWNVPLYALMLSTENIRGFGIQESKLISDIEWEMCYEAKKIFVISEQTRQSLIHDLSVPEWKIVMAKPEEIGDRIEDIDDNVGVSTN